MRAGLAVGAVLLVIAANSGGASDEAAGGLLSVEYRVSGDASSVDVTYQNSNNDTSQDTGEALPYSKRVTVAAGDYVYISAQNQRSYGSVTCEVLVDGVVVESNTSNGGYAICTASGTV